PVLGQLNRSILFATDGVIIPLETSAFGLRGLEYLINYINVIKDDCDTLKILGVLINKLEVRKKVPREVIRLAAEGLGDESLIFNSKIRKDECIPQAQMYNEPIGISFEKSRAYEDFLDVAKEIVDRTKKVILNG
ncbi:MAG: ParA family protein, partial [Peptostreptococcaceae bacterium]